LFFNYFILFAELPMASGVIDDLHLDGSNDISGINFLFDCF